MTDTLAEMLGEQMQGFQARKSMVSVREILCRYMRKVESGCRLLDKKSGKMRMILCRDMNKDRRFRNS
jgi:hypothetical protein